MLSVFQIDFAAREFTWAICLGLVLALICRRSGISRLPRYRNATHPMIQMGVVFTIMVLVQLIVATDYGWPVPALHDEFSYLLAADTFASGRATNPTHPAWEFLETYHVLWQPTYQSKYPPGNGLVLAFGQILSGDPIVGTWICLAVAAAGLYWMLRGWLANRWALVGALVLLGNWPVTKLWGQTFYGGGPALLGGVLVYGAFARLLRRPNWKSTICLATGLVIWSITRPYEGLVASLPVVLILAWRVITSGPVQLPRWLTQCVLPATCVLIAGLCALGWYHQQVTGSPWKWPYRVYEETYTKRVGSLNTLLSWTELGERKRTIPSLEYESSAGTLRIAETKPILYAFWKTVRQWWFHVGLIWTIPFCVACSTIAGSNAGKSPASRRRIVFASLTIALVGLAILLQRSAGLPHYAAPIHPLVVLMIVEGLRRIRVLKTGGVPLGKILVSWMIWSSVLFFILPLITGPNAINVRPWSLERNRLQQELEQHSRPSLVIVRYGSKHSMHEEWVYNRADVDHAQVVWARQLDPSRMPRLIELLPNREVWIVEPDQKPIKLSPYPGSPVAPREDQPGAASR